MEKRKEKTVLVIGGGPLARSTVEDLSRRKGVFVLGALVMDDATPHPSLGTPVLGSLRHLENWLKGVAIDEAYLCEDVGRYHGELQAAVDLFERLGVPFAVPAHVFRLSRSNPVHPNALEDGYVHYQTSPNRPVQAALKRAFDIAVSAAALLALSPLFAVVAALIRTGSPGPVFFRQERVGLHGRRFGMLKFRSMVVEAERLRNEILGLNEQTGPVFKVRNDPRVTPVGRIIRRFSIDELPQLINVLKGDMSIVGPRPPLPSEVNQYAVWQRRRLSMRPGLTCFWQVMGRNEIGFKEWMYLDLQYVDQWSLMSDLRLILRTIPVVATGRGAS